MNSAVRNGVGLVGRLSCCLHCLSLVEVGSHCPVDELANRCCLVASVPALEVGVHYVGRAVVELVCGRVRPFYLAPVVELVLAALLLGVVVMSAAVEVGGTDIGGDG